MDFLPRNNVLQWRPRRPRTAQGQEYRLWSMRRENAQIDCEIEDLGEFGWSVMFRINGQWSVSCRHQSWASAIAAADEKHDDLEAAGWLPLPTAVSGIAPPLVIAVSRAPRRAGRAGAKGLLEAIHPMEYHPCGGDAPSQGTG